MRRSICANAWHGLQRLARKRSFHRLVWHSGCCLSFNAPLHCLCFGTVNAFQDHKSRIAATLLQVVILLSMHPSPSYGSCGCCNMYILNSGSRATATSQYNQNSWLTNQQINQIHLETRSCLHVEENSFRLSLSRVIQKIRGPSPLEIFIIVHPIASHTPC